MVKNREGSQSGAQNARSAARCQRGLLRRPWNRFDAPSSGAAKKHGKNNAQIATAWLLAKGITAPIIGASKMSHLEDAIAAAEIKLTAEEIAYLEEPYKPKAVAGRLQ